MSAQRLSRRVLCVFALVALVGMLAGGVACAGQALPRLVPVSLGSAGELPRVAFEVEATHRYFLAFRLHFDPADPAARARLKALIDGTRPTSAGPTDLPVHLVLRRVDGAAPDVIFDGTVEALPRGFGADWFERTLGNGFLLEPGRYEFATTLLQPRPAFVPYPASLTLSSDQGRVNHGH